MRKLLFSGLVVAMATGVASAQLWSGPQAAPKANPQASVGAPGSFVRAGNVCIYPIPLAGIESFDGFDAVGNYIETLDLAPCAGGTPGQAVTMNGIGWDVTLFADPNVGSFGGSWLSEISVDFNDPSQANPSEFFLRPGAGQSVSGTQSFSSQGIIKLSDVGLPDLVLPTGTLVMQFFESFDDEAGVADGQWLSGALFIQVAPIPEPATMSLLAIGGLVALRRRFR